MLTPLGVEPHKIEDGGRGGGERGEFQVSLLPAYSGPGEFPSLLKYFYILFPSASVLLRRFSGTESPNHDLSRIVGFHTSNFRVKRIFS
jgi:hypothetical protein